MKKKIVIVISELYLGGTEKHLYNVVKRLSQNKNLELLILTLTARGDFYNQFFEIKNIKLKNIKDKKNFYKNKFLKIFVSFLEKILHSKMNLILSNCKEISKQLVMEGISKDKIHVINNGIEINKNVSNKTINDNSKIVFLCLANFIPYKGHDLLIESVNKLDKKILKKLHFLLIGKKNNYSLQISNKINKYELNEIFTIRDQTIDVNHYLQKSHIGISVSHEEGMSNSILEYMNYNMPVIGTRVGGTIELIENNYNGLLINKNNEQELINAIIHYIDNYNLISIHGGNSKKIVNKKFNIEKCVDAYFSLYNSL